MMTKSISIDYNDGDENKLKLLLDMGEMLGFKFKITDAPEQLTNLFEKRTITINHHANRKYSESVLRKYPSLKFRSYMRSYHITGTEADLFHFICSEYKNISMDEFLDKYVKYGHVHLA